MPLRLPVPIASVLALALAAPAAHGGCSREIITPLSSNGAGVVVEGAAVGGVYPDLLRSLGPAFGCTFQISAVPRARQVALFEAGKADVFLPASRTPRRDQLGVFVPMLSNRAMLVSTDASRPPITSAADLLARRELRITVVRGFDYGESYSALVKELSRQGRVFVEVDVNAMVRLLHAGSADIAIVGPTLIAAAIRREPRVAGLQERLRFEAIPELPWNQSGAYISRTSLTPEDQATVRELLERASRSGAVLSGYQRYFKPEEMADSVRPAR